MALNYPSQQQLCDRWTREDEEEPQTSKTINHIVKFTCNMKNDINIIK